MSAVLAFTTRLSTETCCNCGMFFALPEDVRNRRVEDRKSFFCPAGHSQSYTGETEAQRLARELEQMKAARNRSEERETNLRKQNQTLEHRLHGTQGALTKAKKRIGKGACPCCNRHFSNVQKHMATQHPGYAGEVAP